MVSHRHQELSFDMHIKFNENFNLSMLELRFFAIPIGSANCCYRWRPGHRFRRSCSPQQGCWEGTGFSRKVKKSKYLEPCFNLRWSFTPFVVSSDGLLGREAKNLLKQLSLRVADKWQKPYSVVAGIVRSRMSIAIIRASHQCIRGSRISFWSMSKKIVWEDGSGTGLYQIAS